LIDAIGQEAVDEMLDGGVWGCGDSANRLCLLLAGTELSDTATNGIDIEDDAAMKDFYLAIARSKDPALVRIDLKGIGNSHSYIFLSKLQGDRLEGYIYQTNVGIETEMYDLLEWVKDEKSSRPVFLAGHLAELRGRYLGTVAGGVVDRQDVYAENYMLTGKKPDVRSGTKIDSAKAEIRVKWVPVSPSKAFDNIRPLMWT